MTDQATKTLSFCIVTYQTGGLLRGCLDSLLANPPETSYEVVVVDNGSTDGTLDILAQDYPWVDVVALPENRGYTAPMNAALRKASGKYLVQLNPDTLLHPGTFDTLIEFMETHPQVGICTPKVLNRDGSLQKQCRRSSARPWDVIAYFTRLSRFFPNSPLFAGYLMEYMDEDAAHSAEAVSGSCMLIRRDVVERIGYLDERFFAYQEDTDFCFRAREGGWQVWYVPQAQITHFGGEGGSKVDLYRAIVEWHRSYFLYYRKHLAKDYFFLFNWLYYALMMLKMGATLLLTRLRKDKFVGTKKP